MHAGTLSQTRPKGQPVALVPFELEDIGIRKDTGVAIGPGDTDLTSTSTPKSFSLISTRRDMPSSDSTE